MANNIHFKIDSEGRINTTFAYCVICDNKSISFGDTTHNICDRCAEVLECSNNCLVIEDLYHNDEKIIGGRAMIVDGASIKAKSKVVVMSTKEFDKIYELYKAKNN